MKFITLINQVRKAIECGDVPACAHVPRTTLIEIPMRFSNGVKIVPRKTLGIWASFAELTAEYTDPDCYNTYYISMDGVFAVGAFHPSHIVLDVLPTLEVLRQEDMWRRGLQAMLDPANKPTGLYLNPV